MTDVVGRAFELARTGCAASLDELTRIVRPESFDEGDLQDHLNASPALRRQLRALLQGAPKQAAARASPVGSPTPQRSCSEAGAGGN